MITHSRRKEEWAAIRTLELGRTVRSLAMRSTSGSRRVTGALQQQRRMRIHPGMEAQRFRSKTSEGKRPREKRKSHDPAKKVPPRGSVRGGRRESARSAPSMDDGAVSSSPPAALAIISARHTHTPNDTQTAARTVDMHTQTQGRADEDERKDEGQSPPPTRWKGSGVSHHTHTMDTTRWTNVKMQVQVSSQS